MKIELSTSLPCFRSMKSLALLPLGYWLGFLSTPLLFAAAFVSGVAAVFFQLADAAVVDEIKRRAAAGGPDEE